MRRKAVYFLKVQPGPVPREEVASKLLTGDIGEGALEQLQVLGDVFLPLLCNSRNQAGWPEVVTREVQDSVYRFSASAAVTVGLTKGQTVLPVPPMVLSADRASSPVRPSDGSERSAAGSVASDKSRATLASVTSAAVSAAHAAQVASQQVAKRDAELIHVMEASVVVWTRQMKNVLRLEPDQDFGGGAHPGPLSEIEFWAQKASSLNAIREQLGSSRIQRMLDVLQAQKSTFFPAFEKLLTEVAIAAEEANDNVKYLSPLAKAFERLALGDDFGELPDSFPGLFHLLLLVWKHSGHYNTPGRLAVLMRKLCNDLVAQCCKWAEGHSLFEALPQESADKLRTALRVCTAFRQAYDEACARSGVETPDNPWRLPPGSVFSRLDAFTERCTDLADLFTTAVQFGRLEKVEIGGTKGRAFTASVRAIHTDFTTSVGRFHLVSYDVLDTDTALFDADYAAFRAGVRELERRLAALIAAALDDSPTLGRTFKLLDSFEGVLERDLIAADLEKKQLSLVGVMQAEVKAVLELFTQGKAAPPLAKNAAPHSGAVAWCRALRQRVEEPMERLRTLGRVLADTAEGRTLEAQYVALVASLGDFESGIITEWSARAEETGEERLKQTLLVRDPMKGTVSVNFDPALTRLLREVRYFQLQGVSIRPGALQVFKRGETLRTQTGNLELVTGLYNEAQRVLLPIERPLVDKKLENVDSTLDRGLTEINWNSPKVDEYIQELMAQVKDLDGIVQQLKGSVSSIERILKGWAKKPLFDRKEGRTYTVDEFAEANKAYTAARYAEVSEGAAEMVRLLNATAKRLFVPKGGTPAWSSYVAHVSNIIKNGLVQAVTASVKQLSASIDPDALAKSEGPPLLEIGLELAAPEVVWQPELGSSPAKGGVRDMFDAWIAGFLHIGTLVPQVDGSNRTYFEALEQDAVIASVVRRLRKIVLTNEQSCMQFRAQYLGHEHLWKRDLNETLHAFLQTQGGAGGSDPPLEAFDAEIARYKAAQAEVAALPVGASIGWLRIDAKPIKQALSTWVTKWVFLYTHYLFDKVVTSMRDLHDFVGHATKVLDKDPAVEGEPHGRQAALYEVMACMRDVRKRTEKTETSFEPLRATVGLLKSYGIALEEATLAQLEQGPMTWGAVRKRMLNVREKLTDLQQEEARVIRERSDQFTARLDAFRAAFLRLAPFSVPPPGVIRLEDVAPAYEALDAFRHGAPGNPRFAAVGSIGSIAAEGRQLNEAQELFEIFVSDYGSLRRCDEELNSLKALWDMAGAIMHTLAQWNTTTWDKIDVDTLIEETKKIIKEVKALPKAVRGFEAYRQLEEQLKALLTSLPLVSDLHHPSMRDRHWKQLMRNTGKQFVLDDKFSLGDMLALNLHACVDVVSETVERAQKELVIEKGLHKIETTWTGLQLSFAPFSAECQVVNLEVDEAVNETLENDNMALQNMGSSKYVKGNPIFQDQVAHWQRKLGTVDSVLTLWRDVCHKWHALESIFVGSADIRVQLPEDSRRFDGVNVDFQDLQRLAPDTLNVCDACLVEGRQERLERMLALLEQCEKALQDYLETKRIAFPRFYFVSPADLLDILAKGTNPQLIVKHLSKCFDNVHNLKFTVDAATGHPTKEAVGMFSGEGEYVAFAAPCVCNGSVEVWLQRVVDAMRAGLRAEFKAALPLYDEKPRQKWLFDQSVQNSVVISRVAYAQEVNAAFDALEEGNESALKDVYQKQLAQIAALIELINGELSKNDRKKIVTLCTIDTHARDVVAKLVDRRIESGTAFEWASQLRYSQNEKTLDAQVNICDAEIAYMYEYIGNCGTLVITPLTDRCYITLTQAQRLVLGGAPAGPAGTGKTETVKDLGRALGCQVYVFNCSDQMDYLAMGQTYKGLAQTGAWGCFDEFNRIPVAVLSVCSTQYKTVLDAIRARKPKFTFESVDITLRPSAMAFITMNPGYAGRAELPESLKALFRPVSMCIPDLALICEIMLMAEGFLQSKLLARKFIILYRLCEDLLSKAAHYDWKLRAIKTTLYVAGGMKRAQPHLTEDKVLLQALRDFNLGKLTSDDFGIFMGLLNDLFPKTVESVPRRVDKVFEQEIHKAAQELGYQPEETFVLKVTQLREIFEVRWSVFLLGPAGCGKSAVWRTLQRAQNNAGERTQSKPINPKSVTRNELYGYVHPSTREWREGLISVVYRDMSNNTSFQHQWIVLDGDIDAEWIESMNTVMDDNKMLTLASNERIPLTNSMRLLLEINHMVHCTPATVSRGGVIYLNASDVGWQPVVQSWIQARDDRLLAPVLEDLFGRYLEKSLEHCRRNFKTVVPLVAVNQAQTVCKILECLLPDEPSRGAVDKKLLEAQFQFACVWALGGCMLVDKVTDYRAQFSKWWQAEWKGAGVIWPDRGTVFDYFVHDKSGQLTPWEEQVPAFTYSRGNFNSLFVPTVETTRLSFLQDRLVSRGHYVMFVGNAGTGKTALMRDSLRRMDGETTSFVTLNFNNFMDASALQVILEQPLEKKSGVRYGPPAGKKLIYFIDDMNMPFVDKYDTQSPIELARQFVDYRGWYDKHKIVLKEVLDCGYTACMNPTAGSFTITPRMQRHFATFAMQMPGQEIVRSIYLQLVDGHLAGGFTPDVTKLGAKLVDATLELHRMVSATFITSAVKFHYQFNLRDLSSIVQGLCRMAPEYYTKPVDAIRLWVHETERVFLDRMVSAADMQAFTDMRKVATRKFFDDSGDLLEAVEAAPNVHTSFMKHTSEDVPVYFGCKDYDTLQKAMAAKLKEHNESNATMDLVLFSQAMEHVTRIARIIELPRGNALLVGVGGSGKQSLARLAAFICGYEVFQISVTSSYGVAEFKTDLLALYTRCGVKGIGVVFLITDSHIVNERFLVYINDLLSSGNIPDLMTPEEREGMCNSVRNEVKATGMVDSPEVLWDFFIEKVRKNLHVVLCFSPAGEALRVRARNFPALINNTVIDWFQPWPHDALVSVAGRFLADVPDVEEGVREQMALHMAFAHTSVVEASQRYQEQVRRFNYTTPKSFLELISLYKSLLASKREDLRANQDRLENGVDKIAQASAQVAQLQEALKAEQVVVDEKKAATDALIVSIGKEKAVVDEAVAAGREDEEACASIAAEVMAQQASCAEDLKEAEPIIAQAEAALNSLDKKSLGELRSFNTPAPEIVSVLAACMVLTAPAGKIPKDLSWPAAKKFMGDLNAFLNGLLTFDKDNIPAQCVEKCEKEFVSQPGFTAENIKNKSLAAAGLCGWVINICKYWHIYQVVAPKRASLAEANRKLDAANKKLSGVRAKVQELQDKVALLEADLMKATEEKNAAVAAADKTERKARLADKLVNGLSGENLRWRASIGRLQDLRAHLVGDALLAAAFVSYAGPFNAQFRHALLHDKWLPDLLARGIPITDGASVLDQLTTDTEKALWSAQGLPTDPLSVENGAIMGTAARWPLMIDPQLQGIKWIRNKEDPHGLKVVQLSTPKYLDVVEQCLEEGLPLLIENLPEEVDAVLEPVISRQTIKRGRNTLVRLGDKEVSLDPKFRLYLQTKLSNPHYRPEVATQTTLVNFCVTEKGLEDQLLALVVGRERPDLQEQAATLVRQLGEYTITLKELEDSLLRRLAASQGDILEDVELIDNLDETKHTALEISEKVAAAKETEAVINEAREAYRPVAARGSLFYFIIDSLNVLDRVYQYSMANYVYVLNKGIELTPGGADESKVPPKLRLGEALGIEDRVRQLVAVTTRTTWDYIASGLFEHHKLIVAAQLAFGVLRQRGDLPAAQFEFLLKAPRLAGASNPLPEWMPDMAWASVQALKEQEEFASLPDDIISSSKRWRDWMELERPEEEPMPGDWKRLSTFSQLLLFRTLRPDRMNNVLTNFVAHELGREFVTSQQFDLERSFQDAAAHVPIFVFLSPGVDVAAAVEGLRKKRGLGGDHFYAAVSLGQGQEPIAMERLAQARKLGGWVRLQNIHLTIDWTNGVLEKVVDKLSEGTHPDFRLFLSAEPPPSLERPIAISLLQNSIKLTNEPPQGMKANLVRAYNKFSDDTFESCAKQTEFKSIVFALCYFHAALLERKKFGVGNLPSSTSGMGWNMNYPFNDGDLLCCAQLTQNYLDNSAKVPWDDLKFLFGEIMYGGHIVEDWDRRLASSYLDYYMRDELLDGCEMFPKFSSPGPGMGHRATMGLIADTFPAETPLAFGLHPNAEIGFRLREADALGVAMLSLQPREAGGEAGASTEEKARTVVDDILERLPEEFDLEEIRARTEEVTPYAMVAIQETERMNVLLKEIRRSLVELDLGLKGDLTMSPPMETLMRCLANDAVPPSWEKKAWPSMRLLSSWLLNLAQRCQQLSDWTSDMQLPPVIWLSGLFNPSSFLTAVMQTTARRNDWALDRTVVVTEVTKKQPEDITQPSRDGCFVHGLTLEGARWADSGLEESKPKELFCPMPVMLIKAVPVDKAELKDVYQTPVYFTEKRFRQEVFTAQLKTKVSPSKWTLASVALILDVAR